MHNFTFNTCTLMGNDSTNIRRSTECHLWQPLPKRLPLMHFHSFWMIPKSYDDELIVSISNGQMIQFANERIMNAECCHNHGLHPNKCRTLSFSLQYVCRWRSRVWGILMSFAWYFRGNISLWILLWYTLSVNFILCERIFHDKTHFSCIQMISALSIWPSPILYIKCAASLLSHTLKIYRRRRESVWHII